VTRKDNKDSLEVLRNKGMKFVLEPGDLDTDEIAEISRKAGEILMKTGYIPKHTIDQVNQWLAEYRAEKTSQ
jgi:hypothetical protein